MGGAAAGGLWFPVYSLPLDTHTLHLSTQRMRGGKRQRDRAKKTAAPTKLCQNGSGKNKQETENEVGFNQSMTKLQ